MSAQQQGSAAKVWLAVQALLDYGTAKQLIDADNVIFVRNQLMEALGLLQLETTELVSFDSLDEILTVLVNYACDGGIIADTAAARERFDTKLMGSLTPSPHTGVQTFQEAYAESPVHASDWYYQLSKDTNYVRAGRIAQDCVGSMWASMARWRLPSTARSRKKIRAILPRRAYRRR